jgi:hypothetical protein
MPTGSSRGATRWLAGLAALCAACLGLAIWLGAWGAQLFHESDEFYRGDNGGAQYPDEVYEYYQTISTNSYVMHDLQTPLLAGAVMALLALVTVLALRFEQREGASL